VSGGVALGGGHGLGVSLRALGSLGVEVTAIVGVADDGGSSGRLRAEYGDCPAVGDARRALSSLAEAEAGSVGGGLARLLEYRFDRGGLAGHALGNLMLVALRDQTGSLTDALATLARWSGLDARILPASEAPLTLHARTTDGRELCGQLVVHACPHIEEVWVEGTDVLPSAVEDALAGAELIVFGPGSLYTSVLATVRSPGVSQAVLDSPGLRVWIANLAPQEAETRGYTLAKGLAALDRHGVPPEVVLADPGIVGGVQDPRVHVAPLTRDGLTHDPELLAAALAQLTRAKQGTSQQGGSRVRGSQVRGSRSRAPRLGEQERESSWPEGGSVREG